MKNLRKVLSFVLVLAMVLGMVTTAFAAASFTDTDKITNVEAAKVLNAIGVIQGLPDGSFGGAMTLTRDQGATIIARLVLGKDAADKLVAVSAPFSDVPTSHWAAGYISWAAANGIVSGTGNGTFVPGGQLTVVQFAKMCLTALGYKSEVEGFVGDNWSNNVSAAANKAGILKNVVIANDVCTRDVAAQMAFNVLLGTEVSYSNGASVQVGDTKVVVNATRSPEGTFVDNHFAKLTKAGITAADTLYGRPAGYKWTFDSKTVYTSNDNAKLLATYTGSVKKTTLYELLGKDIATTTGAIVKVTIDGNVDGTISPASITAKTGTDTITGIGNGTTTEVYKLSDTAIEIVVVNQYLAKATKDYDKTAEKATLTVYTTSAVTKEVLNEDINVTNVKKNDYFIVTLDAGKVATMTPVTKTTGKVTSYTSGSALVVDGASYSYSAKYVGTKAANKTDYTIGGSVDYILDASNNIIDILETEVDYKYVFVNATLTAVSYNGNKVKADTYDVDGVNAADIIIDGPEAVGWYKYTVNTDGSYKLTDAGIAPAQKLNNVITGGAATFADGIVASKDTKFTVLYTKDSKTTVTTYVGYQNLPSYTTADAYAVLSTTGGFATNVVILTTNAPKDVTTANADYAMLYKADYSEGVDADKVAIKTYKNVVVNGEDTTVVVKSDVTMSADGTLYKLSAKNAAGYVTAATAITDATENFDVIANTTASIKYASGVVTLSTSALKAVKEVAEDCAVYVVSGGAFSTMDASAFATDYATITATFTFALNADKAATAIYAWVN